MADKWNDSERDDEQAIGTEEVRGVASEGDDEEFEEVDDLDDEEEESGSSF